MVTFSDSASTVLVQPAGLCEDCSYSVSTNTSFWENYVWTPSLQAAKVAEILYAFGKKSELEFMTQDGKIVFDFFVYVCKILLNNHTVKFS